MRKIMLPVVFLTAVLGLGSLTMVGCGGDDSSSGKNDMAKAPKPDMVQVTDFTTPPIGCVAFENCIYATDCTTDACFDGCVAMAGGKTGAGYTEFYAAYDCLHGPCGEVEDDMDAGAGDCRYNKDTGAYDDQAACQACIMAVDASGACTAQETTCSNDTTGE